ncbi:MAG: efflux transporter outer membrane subunit [Planctomycetota bacterium]|jgi:NodT family efflux transporter outer membrane factor (OMF) lipoprotein
MTRAVATTISYILTALLLTGCTVGPDYTRPPTAADNSDGYFRAGKHAQDLNDLADINQWWQRFGDPTTAQLVERALANNHNLKAAAARVMQARARLAENRGRRLPEITYNFSRDRNQRSFNFGGFGGGGRFKSLSTTFTQDLSVVYILDLFGKLKHAEQAAWADMLAAQANEQTLINSMIALVVNTRVDIATIQRRLAIVRANTQSRRKTLEIVERRYKQGLVGPVDVRLARENLAAAQAAEPVIELSLITTHHALDVLLALRPGASQDLPQTLVDLPDLEAVPLGLPASLLDRRPDVKAAELALRAANQRVGVSIAQLYPDLTLTGNYGFSGDTFDEIFMRDTEIYSAIFRLAQPIFRGGQLRAQVKGAKARYEELAADYAGTVLTAMKEVEDALAGEQMLQFQLDYAKIQLAEARAAENLSQQRYQRGVEGILTVLESERRRRNAEEQLTVLKGRIWTTRVNLFLALGGDWTQQEQTEQG